MVKIGTIKKNAFAALKKCWAEAIFICLLNTGFICAVYILVLLAARLMGVHTANTIMPVFDSFSAPFCIFAAVTVSAAYIIYCPFHFGIRWYFWQATGGSIMPLSSIFACYGSKKTVNRCIILKLLTDLRRLMFSAVFAGVMTLEFMLGQRLWEYHNRTKLSAALIVCGLSVFALGVLVLYVASTLKYLPVGYIMADNPYARIKEILRLSSSIVSRRYTNMLVLYMSCFGGLIICILVFPIPIVHMLWCMYTAAFLREVRAAQLQSDPEQTAENSEKPPVAVR